MHPLFSVLSTSLFVITLAAGQMISGDKASFCALQRDSKVYCYGQNLYGSFGIGNQVRSPVPVQMLGVTQATHVSHSGDYTCIVDLNGACKCVGNNNYGQLGNGQTSVVPETLLVQVAGLETNTRSVHVGRFFHTCAITDDGSLLCWGLGDSGQLGAEQAPQRGIVFPVPGFTKPGSVVDVGLGEYHTCALTPQGAVYCTGENDFFQLGVGRSTHKIYEMTPVVGMQSNVVTLSVGLRHACVVQLTNENDDPQTVGGGVFCWGDIFHGQLGHGETQTVRVPVASIGLQTGIVSVNCIREATFAITVDERQAYVYGSAIVNERTVSQRIPVLLDGGKKGQIKQVTGGPDTLCILTVNGEVECKGVDVFGQLGNGLPLSRSKTWVKPLFPLPTSMPTKKPTGVPTTKPTKSPTLAPTKKPTTLKPSKSPTPAPTKKPTKLPTVKPSKKPTLSPTAKPSKSPSPAPTKKPSKPTTFKPSKSPTPAPTKKPTKEPTAKPTKKTTAA